MATATDKGDMVNCPICLENYVDPRKLPVCSHTFCKPCAISYVLKLDKNELSETGLPCPFCRTLNPAPKNHDATSIESWANSLDLAVKAGNTDSELGPKDECDSCKVFGISTKATKLCTDCFQLFCVPCSVGRHSGKLYENHTVKDLDESNKGVIKDIQKLKEYSCCKEHAESDLGFYCKNDQTACCVSCLLDCHRHCEKVVKIEDNQFFEQVTKTEIENIKSSVAKLTTFAKKVVEVKKTALTKTKQHIENIKDTLQDVRRNVNQTLDLLEETVTEKTKAILKKQTIKDEDETSALKKHIEHLRNYSTMVDAVIECGCTSHIQGICQNVKEEIRILEMCIFDLCEASTDSTVELKLNAPLQNLLNIEHFNAEKLVTVIETEPKIQLPAYEGFPLLRNHTAIKVCEKSLKENYKDRESPTFTDIVFLCNNCLVLVDWYNGFCCLANDNYDIISSCDLKVKNDKQYETVPRFCTRLGDGKVAVSAPGQRKIFVLNASSKLSIVNEITTKYLPRAIHGLKNGDIAFAWKEPIAFGIFSSTQTPTEKSYFSTDKTGRELKSFEYLAVDEVRKHVIQPCGIDKAVYCFNFEGYPKFKYTNAAMSNPKGVDLDRDGNIYMCSRNESVIHVISPNGQYIRTVKDGCPKFPLAISFKKNGKEFAVTHESNDYRLVTFYKLQPPL